MRKIEAYRVKSGTNLGSSKFWNAILEDVDLRIHARELDVDKIDKAADELIAVGVDRVNSTFNPLIQQSTQAMNDATTLLEAAQAQVAATINEVNEELQTFLDETASQVQTILAGGIDAGTLEEPSVGKVRMLRSTVAGHAPASLEPGEFAINHADAKLFYRTAAGGVGELPLVPGVTQAWVQGQIDALKGSAPATYDTLQEIAAWIASDETAEAAITAALGNRLRFDAEQSLSVAQKARAVSNMGLGTMFQAAFFTTSGNDATFPGQVSAVDFNSTSDRALKDRIEDIDEEAVLAILAAFRPVSYVLRDDEQGRKRYGFIAQDVALFAPEFVSRGADGFLRMNYPMVVPLLVARNRALEAKVDELSARLAALEARMT